MLLNKLDVYLYDHLIGWLEQDRNNKMTFSYCLAANFDISLSMPLKDKTFDDKNCRKYFRGILPENGAALEALCQQIGTHPKDTFGLLKAYGKECIGAISFWGAHEKPYELQNRLIHAQIADQKAKLPQSHNITFHSDSEKKVDVCLVDGKIALIEPSQPATHLLKMTDLNKIMNQYFCFRLAMTLDIQCVNPKLYPLTKKLGLLVERYDRRIIHFHHVEYFHQEDFSQALGYFSSHKYEWDKGPSLKECFAILSKTIVPAIDKLQLVKRVIFNYLIGNTQAHAKNMSLVYYATAKPVLAPLYNVIATIDDTQMMAMKIGNNYTFESINIEDWKIFCREIKFSFCLFKQLFQEIIDILLMQAPKLREEFYLLKYNVKEIDKIIKSLKHRCERYQ